MDRAFFALFIAILACCCLVGSSAIDRPMSTPAHHVNTTGSAVFRKPPIKPDHLENVEANFDELDRKNDNTDATPVYARLFRLFTRNGKKSTESDRHQNEQDEEDEGSRGPNTKV